MHKLSNSLLYYIITSQFVQRFLYPLEIRLTLAVIILFSCSVFFSFSFNAFKGWRKVLGLKKESLCFEQWGLPNHVKQMLEKLSRLSKVNSMVFHTMFSWFQWWKWNVTKSCSDLARFISNHSWIHLELNQWTLHVTSITSEQCMY